MNAPSGGPSSSPAYPPGAVFQAPASPRLLPPSTGPNPTSRARRAPLPAGDIRTIRRETPLALRSRPRLHPRRPRRRPRRDTRSRSLSVGRARSRCFRATQLAGGPTPSQLPGALGAAAVGAIAGGAVAGASPVPAQRYKGSRLRPMERRPRERRLLPLARSARTSSKRCRRCPCATCQSRIPREYRYSPANMAANMARVLTAERLGTWLSGRRLQQWLRVGERSPPHGARSPVSHTPISRSHPAGAASDRAVA